MLKLLSSLWNICHSTTAYCFDPPCTSLHTELCMSLSFTILELGSYFHLSHLCNGRQMFCFFHNGSCSLITAYDVTNHFVAQVDQSSGDVRVHVCTFQLSGLIYLASNCTLIHCGKVWSLSLLLREENITVLYHHPILWVALPPSVPSTRNSHHPSPPHSFMSGLNLPFLQILPTVAFLFFFRTGSTDSPDCSPILLSISVFTFSFFFSIVLVLVPCGRLSWLMSAFKRTLN